MDERERNARKALKDMLSTWTNGDIDADRAVGDTFDWAARQKREYLLIEAIELGDTDEIKSLVLQVG